MKPRYTKNNSNPFSKAYFKEQSKKYIALAKKSFKRLEKENDEMYLDDGTLSDKYNDQTMCDYSDMQHLLEFINDKDDFYNFGSCIVDLITLDNDIERYKQQIINANEQIQRKKEERKHILTNDLKTRKDEDYHGFFDYFAENLTVPSSVLQ